MNPYYSNTKIKSASPGLGVGSSPDTTSGRKEAFNPFGRSKKADEAQIGRAALFQLVDGGHGGVGGRQHRVEDESHAVGEIRWSLEIVLDGLERLGVSVKANMSDAGGRNKGQHAIQKSDARPQNEL